MTCFDDKQFPLYFGDGTTADFKITSIDVNSPETIIVFGGVGYVNGSFTNLPMVGAYTKQGTTSKVSWLKYI